MLEAALYPRNLASTVIWISYFCNTFYVRSKSKSGYGTASGSGHEMKLYSNYLVGEIYVQFQIRTPKKDGPLNLFFPILKYIFGIWKWGLTILLESCSLNLVYRSFCLETFTPWNPIHTFAEQLCMSLSIVQYGSIWYWPGTNLQCSLALGAT